MPHLLSRFSLQIYSTQDSRFSRTN